MLGAGDGEVGTVSAWGPQRDVTASSLPALQKDSRRHHPPACTQHPLSAAQRLSILPLQNFAPSPLARDGSR